MFKPRHERDRPAFTIAVDKPLWVAGDTVSGSIYLNLEKLQLPTSSGDYNAVDVRVTLKGSASTYVVVNFEVALDLPVVTFGPDRYRDAM